MNHHYGKIGDVWKHLPLAEILRLNPPRHYWETHAGSASYPLTETAARRHGVYHFLAHAPGDAQLNKCAYLRALQERPDIYPGSPMLATRTLGEKASYIFCDIDPESAASLRSEVAGLKARVVEADGVLAIAGEARRSHIQPADVFVLIDPFFPFERSTAGGKTPVELAASLAGAGYRLMFWYAFFELEEHGRMRDTIADLAPGVQLWCGETIMPMTFTYPSRSGLFGCGIILANATPAERTLCHRLGEALQRISATNVVKGNNPPNLTYRSF